MHGRFSVQHSNDPQDGSMDFDDCGTGGLAAVKGLKTDMAAPLQTNAGLGSGDAEVVGNDQVRFNGMPLSGSVLNASIGFNLDGTWPLIDAEIAA